MLGLLEPIMVLFLALVSPRVVDEVLGLVPFLSIYYPIYISYIRHTYLFLNLQWMLINNYK